MVQPRNLAAATLLAALALMAPASSSAIAAPRTGSIQGKVTATPSKYLADTVVYLEKVPGTYSPKTVQLDQKNRTFIPHILTITVGDTVKFLNSDPINHNVYSPDCGYNLGVWGKGVVKTHRFTKKQVCTQLCSLHPEMISYIFVGQNPYSAAVDAQGNVKIENVPAGTYQISVWNPKLKAASKSVTVKAGKPSSVSFSLSR